MRTILSSGALAASLALAGGPGRAPLRISLTADIRSTEPGVNRDSNSDAVVLHIVEGLVAYGEDAEVRPAGAVGGHQPRRHDLHLHAARRHPVPQRRAADVRRRALVLAARHRAATGWRCASEFDGRGAVKVLSVQAPDPRTVVYRLERPSSLFLATLARTDCGGTGIVHRDSVKPDGAWDKPIGTGPFMLTEWKRGEYIRLARYAGYANRDGKPDGYTGSKDRWSTKRAS